MTIQNVYNHETVKIRCTSLKILNLKYLCSRNANIYTKAYILV